MPFETSGSLTTDEREVNTSTTWDTQTDWEAYQAASNIAINNGAVELAEAATTFDDFEDGDVSEYSGDTGSFTATDTNSQAGTYSGELTTTSGSVMVWRDSPTFQQGQTLDGYFRFVFDTFNVQFIFGQQGSTTDNAYLIQAHVGNSELRLFVIENGNATEIATTSNTWTEDTWTAISIDWGSSGQITVDSDGAQVQATDTTFTTGSTGFGVNTGTAWFDTYTIQ